MSFASDFRTTRFFRTKTKYPINTEFVTLKTLKIRLKLSNSRNRIMTDYWKAYQNFIPQDKHVQSKAETFTVEGYNSLFRHFLARLRRKSKCYSKNADRLKEAVMLFMLKRNNQLSILN